MANDLRLDFTVWYIPMQFMEPGMSPRTQDFMRWLALSCPLDFLHISRSKHDTGILKRMAFLLVTLSPVGKKKTIRRQVRNVISLPSP